MQSTRVHFIVAILFSYSFLCSCGSGAAPRKQERDAAETVSTPAPSTVDKRPVIVAFGDSLTAGVSGRSYPEALQSLLDRENYHYRVENQGVSGDTTSDGLARIDNVVVAKPALVLLEFGGNDGLRGVPIESTRENLTQMVQRIKQANIPLVLLGITLPPNYGADYVRPFTAIFPDLAVKEHLKLMPFLLLHVFDNPSLMQPDGIHPNEEGNKLVARDVLALIKPQLTQ